MPNTDNQYDILIIGSGIAGLYTALHTDPKLRVLFVTKEGADTSNSWLAQGGIAAAIKPEDSSEEHYRDTLEAGAGANDPEAVRVLVEEGPREIETLRRLAVPFDLATDGTLSTTLEGGHRRHRVVHAGGDATGRETVKTLAPAAQRRGNITFWERSFFWDLIVSGGRVTGAFVLYDGEMRAVSARCVVLCTGGSGRIYSRSTNPVVATGDGIAAAERAGAALKNMAFIQFHPTGLSLPPSLDSRKDRAFLISEAVRGEGALLRNRQGERFMAGQHPLNELAPRDIVARAIYRELQHSGEDCVYLDITHHDAAFLQKRFPTIYGECAGYGIYPERDWIPVAPVQHYMVGGVATGLWGETTLPGLYAVGESACTGVHGANRLASNSMLECLVFGRRCAEHIERNLPELTVYYGPLPDVLSEDDQAAADGYRRRITHICDRYAGIIRTPNGVRRGAEEMAAVCEELSALPRRGKRLQEVLNIAVTARAVLVSAGRHTVSLGTHYIEAD